MSSTDWEALGLCREVGGDLFFPDKGDPGREAKAVCRRCDVREQCLDAAIERAEPYGLWGGLGRHQRDKVAKRRTGQVAA